MIAFALIGLVMAVLIVGNVISGAVVAQYQRIGVLKSLGLTPAQVVAVYLSRIGWPALVGCLIGRRRRLPALASPCCTTSAERLRRRQPAGAAVGAGPGARRHARHHPAGRARPGAAGRPAVGGRRRSPPGARPATGRGYAVHRLAARLRLPRPVSLGLAAPFARPARTLVTLAAVAFGATAVIFAVGLHSSLSQARGRPDADRHGPGPGPAEQPGAGPGPGARPPPRSPRRPRR